jgi:predicted dehydrogenase
MDPRARTGAGVTGVDEDRTTDVVLIGCGAVGWKRAAALPDRCRLVAAVDPVAERAERLVAALAPSARAGATAEEGLASGDGGLAIVATPHVPLVPSSLAALAAGWDVLVEKPGADRLAPLLELQDAARAAGRTVRVGFNHRFHPSVRKAAALLAAADHGSLMHIRAHYGHGGRPGYELEWRADRAVSGGGELLDQGVHLLDLVRHFAGDVDLAFAECRTDFWKMDVEDNAFLALRPRSGGFVWLHASWTEWKNTFSFEIALQRAKLWISGLGGSYGTERLTLYEMQPGMGPPATTAWEWPQADASWQLEVEDVLRVLDGGAGVGTTLEDCIAVHRIVEQAYAR